MKWMLLPYQRYFDFAGRSQRMEYWMFYLLWVIALLALAGLMLAGLPWNDGRADAGVMLGTGLSLLTVFMLGSFIPGIAVTVRRFHDQNLSGWMYLLGFIPYVGWIVVFVFMCIEGTRGPNQYGSDPKGRGDADVFA